jgi:hypothetical protein
MFNKTLLNLFFETYRMASSVQKGQEFEEEIRMILWRDGHIPRVR